MSVFSFTVNIPIATASTSWLTFYYARMFGDFSIRLRLPTASIPQTENSLCTNFCGTGEHLSA